MVLTLAMRQALVVQTLDSTIRRLNNRGQIGLVRSVARRFSNNNGDGKENVKKAIGILSKTTTRASYFF